MAGLLACFLVLRRALPHRHQANAPTAGSKRGLCTMKKGTERSTWTRRAGRDGLANSFVRAQPAAPAQLPCPVFTTRPEKDHRRRAVRRVRGLHPWPKRLASKQERKKGKEYVPLASTSTLSKERKSNKEAPFLTGKDTNQGTDTSGWSEACSCSLDCVVR